jgi:quinol monooxygenase YgiN
LTVVTGEVEASPEIFAEILRLSIEHVHRSRAEVGCVSYDVHIDAENPLRLFFFERWESMDELKTHFGVPASREFGRRLGALAAKPPTLLIYQAEQAKP